MPTAPINDTTIHYEVDGSGLPALVLHGGLGFDHSIYRATLGPLTDRLRVVWLDHRGNGRSGRPPLETITMEQLADDAVDLARHLGFDRVVVIGHSYGGFVAQELALRHPAHVAGLVLIDTTPGQLGATESPDDEQGPPMPPEVAARFAVVPASDEEFKAMAAEFFPNYLYRPETVDAAALLDATVYDVAAMIRGFEVLAGWSSVDRLATITAPTLVMAGRHDVFTSWPQAMRIARAIDGAEVVVFEASGHFPWIEEPERFFAVVGDWLDRNVTW